MRCEKQETTAEALAVCIYSHNKGAPSLLWDGVYTTLLLDPSHKEVYLSVDIILQSSRCFCVDVR